VAGAHAASAAAPPSLLAGYSFEEEDLATGPDTFAVFRAGRGDVRLSDHFRVSGYHSVEIRDAARDHEFPELQGYFPVRANGHLHAHFAFLTTDVSQTLNIALAGPEWFRLAKDGIAFWLAVHDGMLVHTSDSIPKRLREVQPFVWYTVDLDYDVAAGRYDLRINEEGRPEPFVSLRAQPNAANQPGSRVDKFSFVGDVEDDATAVTYYVDDVYIGTSEPAGTTPFVAPGRRKLFFDSFKEYRRVEAERIQCLPILGPEDIGLDAAGMRELAQAELLTPLQNALATGATPAASGPGLAEHVTAAAAWGAGCAALVARQNDVALAAFERAAKASPRARMYELSVVLPLLAMRRFDEAEERLARVMGAFGDDPRPAVVYGVLGLRRGDAARARVWLERPANTDDGQAASRLAAEAYYYALLADHDHRGAREWSARRAQAARGDVKTAASWLERAADADYYMEAYDEARVGYEAAAKMAPERSSLWLKLADLAFLRGDVAGERRLRERIYGSLR
jgi:tetratricopeptide (TPR) repeat protein